MHFCGVDVFIIWNDLQQQLTFPLQLTYWHIENENEVHLHIQ